MVYYVALKVVNPETAGDTENGLSEKLHLKQTTFATYEDAVSHVEKIHSTWKPRILIDCE